jgi:predicted kinase
MKEPYLPYIETKLKPPFLLITCGLPSTAKTTAGRAIAAALKNVKLLRSDEIRREVLKNEDIFDEKVAADMDKRLKVYEQMFQQADEELKKCNSVILDATFVTQKLRQRAAAIAAKYKTSFIILETVCPQETAIRRLQTRTREKYESNALTEQAYLNVKKEFEYIDAGALKKLYPSLNITCITVDTAKDTPVDWRITGVS